MFSENSKSAMRLLAVALALMLATKSAQAALEFGIPTPPDASPNAFNIEGGYGYPSFSPDDLTMYFASDRPGPNSTDPYSQGQFDIWTSERASVDEPWGPFVNLGDQVNTSEWAEFASSVTADGEELYFMRALSPFSLPEGDLFVSQRQSDGTWGAASPLTALNTVGSEGYPSISADGLTLYFNTHLSNTYPNPTGLTFNTYVAQRSSRSEPFTDWEFFFGGYGAVTPDGLTHIMLGYPDFAEYYGQPNLGNGDLYIRTRESVEDDFGPVQHLPAPVNSSGQLLPPPLTGVGLECCAMFTASGSSLYFTSVRPGTDASGPVGFVDMWQAPIAEAVTVEVKPGSDPAPINLKSKGVLPVAILSTEAFDATRVDPETLQFGDPLLIADGALPVAPLKWSYGDVDNDGLEDLALKFSMRDLLDHQVISGQTTEGYLAGLLLDGSHIAGRDTMLIVPGNAAIPEPSSLLLLLAGLLAALSQKR